jgi:hypothetical protein
MKVQSIALPVAQPSERIVKKGALLFFRAVRLATEQAKRAPGIIAQATSDIRDAWEESSRPNA